MDLIKRYIYAVGRWIPGKQKTDILKELESSIYDMLEARFGEREEYSKEQVEEALRELGPPWKVASSYTRLGDRLIGPELLPLYFMLAFIISSAVALGLFISFAIGLFTPETTFVSFVLDFLKLIFSVIFAAASVIGILTIIFTIIERFSNDEWADSLPDFKKAGDFVGDKTWSPSNLPSVPVDKQRISLWEPVVAIFFIVAAFMLFNFFRDILGIYYLPSQGGDMVFVPIFSEEAIKGYLPLWNFSLLVSLIFNILLIIKMRWTFFLRFFDIFTSVIDIVILSIMIRGAELIDIRTLLSHAGENVSEALTPFAELIGYSIDFILIFALVASCIGLIAKVVKLFIPANYSKSG